MTPLDELIRGAIDADGPMRLDTYMALCLHHPQHGYYASAPAIGASGDFVTAPEISQIFGELLGLWLADRWLTLGTPNPVAYVELGPGRGTLAADILRAFDVVPELAEAVEVHLVESNATLKAEQAKRVPGARWHETIESLPALPTLLVANEFFDALPIRQCFRRESGWVETHVVRSEDVLVFKEQPSDLPAQPVEQDACVEICAMGKAIAGGIARHIATHGGAGLIIDYGYEGLVAPASGSFQAVASHNYASPLIECGRTDLTAHVAFDRLAAALRRHHVACAGPATQAELLQSLGIGMRARNLIRANPGRESMIRQAVGRLTDADQMGTLFKALAVVEEAGSVPGLGRAR